MKIPKYMKAAQAKDYGDVDEMISVQDDVPVPNLQDEIIFEEDIHPMMKKAIQKDSQTHMIVKTLAVALAPGDARVLSGKTRRMQGPPKFPYIVGGDCCGIVVDPGNSTTFSEGELVAARFTVAPRNALAEYARVSDSVCDKVPPGLTPEAAAALASASPAVELADVFRPKERVLILGAGGGVGSHLCQLAKRHKHVAYVCGVSSDPQRLLKAPLYCDDAVDYTKESVFEMKKYQEDPFDTIIDLASGGWPALLKHRSSRNKMIVKPASRGGRFITITVDTPEFEGNFFSMLAIFLFKPLGRKIWSRLPFQRTSVPAFTHTMALPETREIMTKTMRLAKEGEVEAVVDGPYPMTTEGVQKAFHKLKSRHANGKVVIKVANTSSSSSSGNVEKTFDA
mmetsp:Transcript_3/g.4  ORF Transcript_3/g.4 Transcript_3/m.4 type:complete len:396 (+) Transcript_3:90-1277(+)